MDAVTYPWSLLYARSRGWAASLAGLVVLTAIADLAAAWLASRPYFSGADARVPVVTLVPVAAAALVGVCLGGHDVELDRCMPYPWRVLRLRDVVGWTLLACVGLALIVRSHPQVFGALAIVRNVIGYVGLACLATVFLGTALSWLPGFLIAGILYLAAPRPPTGLDRLWAWSMTAGTVDLSWVVPLSLFVLGTGLYTVRGPVHRHGGS